ncbi:MAG: endonuclease/exonuclease/phosphatase family protein [Nocardioidaceae bacterium]
MSRRTPWRRALRALAAPTAVLSLATALAGSPSVDLTPVAQQTPTRTGFNLATFNILGSQHTGPNSGYAPGTTRARWAAQLLLDRRVGVVGFQEIQPDQLSVVRARLGRKFATFPGTSMGYQGVPQNVMWSRGRWTKTADTTVTVPFLGQQRIQPAVRLRNKVTGRQIWVINAHNAPRGRQAERDVAVAREAALVRRLSQHGLPVFLVGDLNETQPAFCTLTATTALLSPAGGSNDEGYCQPPAQMRIDWIFGTGTDFSGYLVDRSAEVARITDHPVLFTRAILRSRTG